MSSQPIPAKPNGPPPDRFVWHPVYHGRTVAEVREVIRAELHHDQRVLALAMEGADRHENDTLATVVGLERKWGTFDLDWAETDAATLAETIVAFEQERERRRELFPYGAYRARPTTTAPEPRRAGSAPNLDALPTALRSRLVWLGIAVVLVLLLLGLLT